MALQKSAVSLRFTGGIQRIGDEKLVPATKLLALENGVFSGTTSGSIAKRNGYESLSKSIESSVSLVSGAERLATRDGVELLTFTRDNCYSHQTDADQWSDAGAVFSVVGSDRPAVRTGTQQTMSDHATANGVSVYAWEDSAGGVWWSVIDATSGRILKAATQADALGERPRCVPAGDVLHVYYAVPSQISIMVLVVNPSLPSADVTPVILVNDLDATNPVYDACPTDHDAGNPACIAWHENATTSYRVGFVHASGVLGSPAISLPSVLTYAAVMTATSPIAIAHWPLALNGVAQSDYFAVAYATGTTGVVDVFNCGDDTHPIHFFNTATWAAVVTDLQRITIEFQTNDDEVTDLWVAGEEAAAEASNRFVRVNQVSDVTATPVVLGETKIRSVGLASKAFNIYGESDVFAYFVHDTTYFNVYLCYRLSDFACIARQLAGAASGAPTQTHLSSAHVVDDMISTCLPYKERLLSENDDKFTETGLKLLELDFDNEDSHQTAQLGRGLYMAGACPQHYDGRIWTEQGFHVGPELIDTAKAGGGSMTSLGVFLYVAWYEWTDSQGEVHRGPTSVGTSVTLGGADTQVTLTLPTLRVTAKTGARICVARSRNGQTTELFRVSSLDTTTEGDPNGYVANDPTADTVTFLDRMSDATLAEQEPLYTNGGVLSTDPSALGYLIAGSKERLFCNDPSDGNTIRFSQELDPGYGVEFPPELVVKVDPYGGDVTAIAAMDDVVYAFKESAIFAFSGDGPLPNGDISTGGFSKPQLITSDVGCTDPASIVLTPVGLMFKSAKGIYILDRGRSVSYVGALAEAFNSQTIRRATVMPDRSQVVFLTEDGTTLLYDFLFQQWSTFTNHEGKDSAVVNGRYHYLRNDDRVYRETPGEYSDNGTRITLRIETAWIHLQEHLQGFQRFNRALLLGTRKSAHQLRMQYKLDYLTHWSDPVYHDATGLESQTGWISGDNAPWNGTGDDSILGSVYGDGEYGSGVYGGTQPDVYQWRFDIESRGQSVQFRFEDFEASGYTGASFEMSELTVVGGVKGPVYKPIAASRSR